MIIRYNLLPLWTWIPAFIRDLYRYSVHIYYSLCPQIVTLPHAIMVLHVKRLQIHSFASVPLDSRDYCVIKVRANCFMWKICWGVFFFSFFFFSIERLLIFVYQPINLWRILWKIVAYIRCCFNIDFYFLQISFQKPMNACPILAKMVQSVLMVWILTAVCVPSDLLATTVKQVGQCLYNTIAWFSKWMPNPHKTCTVCTNGLNSYKCERATGFAGDNCETSRSKVVDCRTQVKCHGLTFLHESVNWW